MTGTVVGVVGDLVETLVLLLFTGVFFACYIFRLSCVIGMLSSESSVEILSMGEGELVLLGDMDNSAAACSFSVTCRSVCWGCSRICSVC